MVGAGIYVLVGVSVGVAGLWAPLSFVIAALVALPTALTYSDLAARIPVAAGDSAYVSAGLHQNWLAILIGFVNILSGTVGAAAVLRGGVGYLVSVVPMSFDLAVIGLGVVLTVIALLNVAGSLGFVAALTLVEVVGLLLVIGAGFSAPPVADWHLPLAAPHWSGVIAASVFAFFAFLGFDDLVNLAEEARAPERNMPLSILISLAITTLLYVLVTLAAERAVPRDVLAHSMRPLAQVWENATGHPATVLALIAVASALNGVLAQIVMAARVLFGLGTYSRWLTPFHSTSQRFHTPVAGTLLVGTAVVLAALSLPVATLAEVTSEILLGVFAIVNLSLIRLKRQAPEAPFRVPVWVPWLGLISCCLGLAAALWSMS